MRISVFWGKEEALYLEMNVLVVLTAVISIEKAALLVGVVVVASPAAAEVLIA